MLWSYGHLHNGGINMTMEVNGKLIGASVPIYGTDPSNPPGNEAGYVVNITSIVDSTNKHNALHLNKGDVVRVTSNYDVDPSSKRAAPMPGGKHGGVMGLFWYQSICDDGTTDMEFVCRQSSCVPVGKSHGKGKHFKTRTACAAACK